MQYSDRPIWVAGLFFVFFSIILRSAVLSCPILVFLWVPFYSGVLLLEEVDCCILRAPHACNQLGDLQQTLMSSPRVMFESSRQPVT